MVAKIGFDDDHVDCEVKSRMLESLKVPLAAYDTCVPTGTLWLAGPTASEVIVALDTLTVVEPTMPEKMAVMVVCPGDPPITLPFPDPPLPTVGMDGWVE